MGRPNYVKINDRTRNRGDNVGSSTLSISYTILALHHLHLKNAQEKGVIRKFYKNDLELKRPARKLAELRKDESREVTSITTLTNMLLCFIKILCLFKTVI